MKSQGPDKENNSEEIYQHMIEEVFDVPEVEKARSAKNFLVSDSQIKSCKTLNL